MWVESYKDKYRAFERYIDPLTGKSKRVSTIIDKDTRGARKAAESVLRDKINEAMAIKADADITLKELSDKYIEHQKQNTRPQTWVRDERMVKTVVKILGADARVNVLTARMVDDAFRKTGKPNVTLNTYLKHFRMMIKWGYASDYTENVQFLAKLKNYPDKEKKTRIEDKYMSSDELALVLEGMKVERWRLLTEFLALSGLRIGEATALDNADLTDVIAVCKTCDPNTSEIMPNPKTDASNREVFIQPELESVVKRIRAFVRKDSFQHGYRSSLFLPGVDGNPADYAAYNKYLKENTLNIIGRALTPHALRHTHVSLLAEAGVPLDVISRRIGHADSKITRQIYLHITEKQKEKDREQLRNVKIL